MKALVSLLLVAALSALLPAQQTVLLNSDIIALVEAGKTDGEIIATIRASRTAFDLTAAGRQGLLEGGVSHTVIDFMERLSRSQEAVSAPRVFLVPIGPPSGVAPNPPRRTPPPPVPAPAPLKKSTVPARVPANPSPSSSTPVTSAGTARPATAPALAPKPAVRYMAPTSRRAVSPGPRTTPNVAQQQRTTAPQQTYPLSAQAQPKRSPHAAAGPKVPPVLPSQSSRTPSVSAQNPQQSTRTPPAGKQTRPTRKAE